MIKKYFVMGFVLLILFPALSWGADEMQLQDNGWIKIIREYVSEEPSPIIEGKMWRTLVVTVQFLKYAKAIPVEEESIGWGPIFNDGGKAYEKFLAENKIDTKQYIKRFASDYHFKIMVNFSTKIGTAQAKGQYIVAGKKDEAVPGEVDFLTFSIPDYAVSWKAWVPK